MKKKFLKYILIGILIFAAIVGIELGIVYAVEGDNFGNYLKEYWEWCKLYYFNPKIFTT